MTHPAGTGTVTIVVNGSSRPLPAGTALAEIVRELVGGDRPGVAAAVNGEVVRRAEWAGRLLRDGDSVEIVRATQGG